MPTARWYLEPPRDALTPLTDRDLKQQVKVGTIGPDTNLWVAGRATPVSARRIQGLFPDPTPTHPQPPSTTSITRRDDEPFSASSGLRASTKHKVELPDVGSLPPMPAVATLPNLAQDFGIPAGQPLFTSSPTGLPTLEDQPRGATTRLSIAPTGRIENTLVQPANNQVWQLPPPRPQPLRQPLGLPPHRDVWPILALIVGVGWIGGSIVGDNRGISSDSHFVIFLLCLTSIPACIAAFWYWLRPRFIPVGVSIATGIFTATIGILLLLVIQFAAAFTGGVRIGPGAFFSFILYIIGTLYQFTNADSIVLNWIGFVFGVGLCEEMIKLVPLAYLLHGTIHRRLGLHGFIAMGFISGIGFGVSEAFFQYNPWNGMYQLDANLMRWFAVMPTHGLYTAASAAALWKLSDRLKAEKSFYAKLYVVALAAMGMALIHGTYNTLCNFGTVAAVIMDVISIGILSWWVRHCSAEEDDPPEVREQSIVRACMRTSTMWYMLGGSALCTLFVVMVSTDAKAAQRSHIPPQYIALVDGLPHEPDEGEPDGIAVTFRLDLELGCICAEIVNTTDTTYYNLECIAAAPTGEIASFTRMSLPANSTITVGPEDDWLFEPGETLAISWDDHPDQVTYRFRLPPGVDW